MELETWVHNDKKVKDMLNQLLIPSIPLAMLTKILKSPSLVDRYYNLFKKSQYEWIGNLLPNRLVKCPRVGCDEGLYSERTLTKNWLYVLNVSMHFVMIAGNLTTQDSSFV